VPASSADPRHQAAWQIYRQSLVRVAGPEEAQYQHLMDNNRDIFAEYLWDSWPATTKVRTP
jgi:hypothetical protein